MRRHAALAPLLVVLLALPAFAHGPEGPAAHGPAVKGPAAQGSAAKGPAASAAPKEDPCAVLTEAMVRAALSLPAGLAIKGGPVEGSPACAYTWEKPERAAINERNTKRMIEEGQQALEAERDGKATPPRERMERTDAEVRLLLPPTHFGTKAKAKEAFARSLKRMARGQVVDVEGQTFLNQARFAPVKGIGDLAAWSAHKNELGFVKGDRIYWVFVDAGKAAADNQALAVALAKQLAATR